MKKLTFAMQSIVLFVNTFKISGEKWAVPRSLPKVGGIVDKKGKLEDHGEELVVSHTYPVHQEKYANVETFVQKHV